MLQEQQTTKHLHSSKIHTYYLICSIQRMSSVLIKSGHQRFRDCDPIFVGAGAVMVCAGLSIFLSGSDEL